MIALKIKFMNIFCCSYMYIIFREWPDYAYCSIETILFDRILFDSYFDIFRFRVPVSYYDAFGFYLWLNLIDLIILFNVLDWLFAFRNIFKLTLWWLFIKVTKLNSRQIHTFYRFLLLIIINTLKCLIINNNFQWYK